jgi:hypothetical protein
MAMDIALATGVGNQALELRNCRRLDDRDYSSMLSVRSGPFSADMAFYFEAHGLTKFVADLESLNKTLTGRARLKLEHEDPFLELEGDGRGHIKVRGKLLQAGPDFQTLSFEFTCDQTALPPFVEAMKGLQREHVT